MSEQTIKTLIGASMNWGVRLSGAAVQLLTINALHTRLDVQQFSIFSVLMAFSVWYQLVDFGMATPNHNLLAVSGSRADGFKRVLTDPIVPSVILFLLWILVAQICPTYFFGDSFRGMQISTKFLLGGGFVLFGVSAYFTRLLYAVGKGVSGNACLLIGQITVFVVVYLLKTLDGYSSVIVWLYGQNAFVFAYFLICNYDRILPLEWDINGAFQKGMPFFVMTFFSFCIMQVDVLVLNAVADKSITGGYFALSKLLAIVYFSYNSVLMIVAPRMVNHIEGFDHRSLHAELKKMRRIGFMIVVLTFGGLIVFSKQVISVYPAVFPVLGYANILVFSAYYLIRVHADSSMIVLQSIGDVKAMTWILPMQCVINTGGLILMVGKFGVLGVGLTYVISFLFSASMLHALMHRALAKRLISEF